MHGNRPSAVSRARSGCEGRVPGCDLPPAHRLLHLFQLLALLPFDDLKISGKPVVTSA